LKRIVAGLLVIAAGAVIVASVVVIRSTQQRSMCDHYRTVLQAAVANPASTAPIVGLDPPEAQKIAGVKSQYRDELAKTLKSVQQSELFGLPANEASERARIDQGWDRYAAGFTASALSKRNC